MAEQQGLCAVCWKRPPEHVDHDHDTGAVRYALQLGPGQFRDQGDLAWPRTRRSGRSGGSTGRPSGSSPTPTTAELSRSRKAGAGAVPRLTRPQAGRRGSRARR
ncbi:endonuclease domain-containing protein [Planotetraspora sp. GP83]|uniref:endonuclease domain-containing protein n=1 Tax=Planotetraspora sp. GP83 TaxID=3156264 RepID=UPI0035159975